LNIATAIRAFLADAVIPTTVEEVKSGHNKDQWESAIKNEYDSLIQNNTWTLVDNTLLKLYNFCIKHFAFKKNLFSRYLTVPRFLKYFHVFEVLSLFPAQ